MFFALLKGMNTSSPTSPWSSIILYSLAISTHYSWPYDCFLCFKTTEKVLLTLVMFWFPIYFSLIGVSSYIRLNPSKVGTSMGGPNSDVNSLHSRCSAHVLWPAESVPSCAHEARAAARRGIWDWLHIVSSWKSGEINIKHFFVYTRVSNGSKKLYNRYGFQTLPLDLSILYARHLTRLAFWCLIKPRLHEQYFDCTGDAAFLNHQRAKSSVKINELNWIKWVQVTKLMLPLCNFFLELAQTTKAVFALKVSANGGPVSFRDVKHRGPHIFQC